MRNPTFLLLLTCATPVATIAGAQSLAERATIESFRSSLHESRDDSAETTDRSLDHLKTGFRLLGPADSSSTATRALQALDAFYEVTVREPRWPYGWYGLGLAKLALYRLGNVEIRSPHQPAGSGWLPMAGAAFIRALKVDSSFSPAASGLSEVILTDLNARGTDEAFAALARHTRLVPPDTTTLLALARLYIARDSFPAATIALEEYLSGGGDSGVASFELARSAFGAGDSVGGALHYYTGAAQTDQMAAAELYSDDLALVGDSGELAEFKGIPAIGRTEWLRRFWSVREVEAGRPAGSRLPEHFRRERYAREHFSLSATTTQYSFAQIYRGAPHNLDDRGVIYIRHGEPDERANFVGDPNIYPNETWLYFRTEGNLIFHFAAMRNTGWRLIETLFAVVRSPDSLPPDLLAQIFESRAGIDIEYLQLASLYELDVARLQARVGSGTLVNTSRLERERERNRSMVALGTTTDSDPLDLERSWSPTTQVFGSTQGLLVAIALPATEDLQPITLPDGGAGYTLRLRTTAANDSGQTTLDADSIIRLRTPRPLKAGEYLNIVRYYDLPAGTQRVRVVVADSTGARGAIRVLNGVPVISARTDSLSLSDLIVGREGSGITWRRPDGERVPLQPLNAWTPAQSLALAFDIGGTTPGASYKVRIAIADLGADSTKPPRASVEFDKVATDTREFVSQNLGLSALRPGRYLLTVTVTAGDRSVRRERRITVVR